MRQPAVVAEVLGEIILGALLQSSDGMDSLTDIITTRNGFRMYTRIQAPFSLLRLVRRSRCEHQRVPLPLSVRSLNWRGGGQRNARLSATVTPAGNCPGEGRERCPYYCL
jgi:hypothetical protein